MVAVLCCLVSMLYGSFSALLAKLLCFSISQVN